MTLIGYLGAMEQRIVSTLRGEMRTGQEILREEMRAGHELLRGEIAAVEDSLRGEIRTVHESLTGKIAAVEEKLREENRGIRMPCESLQADVRAVWAEGVAAITEGQNRRLEELREHFDVRLSAGRLRSAHERAAACSSWGTRLRKRLTTKRTRVERSMP